MVVGPCTTATGGPSKLAVVVSGTEGVPPTISKVAQLQQITTDNNSIHLFNYSWEIYATIINSSFHLYTGCPKIAMATYISTNCPLWIRVSPPIVLITESLTGTLIASTIIHFDL